MAKARTELDSQELAREVARLADTKLADDIVVLDMRDLVAYTDYLVIATARNERQAKSIVDEVHHVLKREKGLLPVNPDRAGETGWSVLDYLDVVCHGFTEDARQTYDLEEPWPEAPRLEIEFEPHEADPVSAA